MTAKHPQRQSRSWSPREHAVRYVSGAAIFVAAGIAEGHKYRVSVIWYAVGTTAGLVAGLGLAVVERRRRQPVVLNPTVGLSGLVGLGILVRALAPHGGLIALALGGAGFMATSALMAVASSARATR